MKHKHYEIHKTIMKTRLVATSALLFLLINLTYSQSFFDKISSKIDTILIKQTHKKADRLYNGLAYAKAIEKYQKLQEKGFMPDTAKRKLATSYYKVHNTGESEMLFSELVAGPNSAPLDMYYLSQSLKNNKKYDEADIWIAKYNQVAGEDTRGMLQLKSAQVVKKITSKEKYKVEPVWFNSKYSEFGAVQIGDEIVFASGRNENAIIQYEYSWKGSPYLDIYRTTEKEPVIYTEPKLVSKGINSRFHDGPLAYSPNGEEIFITRNNFHLGLPKYSDKKENHFKIYSATNSNGKWTDLVELSFNNDDYSCGHPSVSADNTTLYFASDMPGGYGESDIYYVTRIDSGWSHPVNLGPDVNTEGDEMFPFVSPQGDIYFSSNGQLGLGGLDIFMASPSKKGGYGVLNMGYPLNSSNDDFSFYLLKNGWDGYFASNREGGKGDDDIYKFTILDKPTFVATFVGTTIDESSSEILPETNVKVINDEGTEIFKGISDANGKFSFEVTPGFYYTIYSSKKDFKNDTLMLLADKDQVVDDKIAQDIPIAPELEWGVFGFIYQKETNQGVEGVEVRLSEKDGDGIIVDFTNGSGNFRKLLKQETDYDVLLIKKDFFTRRGSLSTKGMEPGWIDIKDFVEVEMEQIEVGKTIEIPNIYYDVAKWDIRPDAAIELDKVVQFLIDNDRITIELGSHTDSRGSTSSNQALSQKRAESAVNYIVGKGINAARISAKGYGESKLKNRCADGVRCSKEEHQENRRTEIMVVDI